MIAMATNSTNIIYRDLSYQIMGAIFEVHKELGPGFLESVYKKALVLELTNRGIRASGHRLGILVNFSKAKVESRRVVIG